MANHLYDTHFHLDLFENINEIIEEIERYKVYTIAVTTLPILFTKLVSNVDSKYIRPALGFHPDLLFQYEKYIPDMWRLLSETRYIGEVGLDFKTGKEFKQLQIKFFEELISRCNIFGNKILTVHSRMSSAEIVSIIGHDFSGIVIMHWYSGNQTILKRALDNGYYFSVNYSMVSSNSGREIIKQLPLNRILLETDAPFIKFKDQPFRPSNISAIVNNLSQILNLSKDEMAIVLWKNFKYIIN